MELVDLACVDEGREAAVEALLDACADEFVPPLAARHSTSQLDLGPDVRPDGSGSYFDEMRLQPIVLALEGGELAGFLSYKPDFSLDFLGEPSCYVTTVCVDARFRRHGVATALYAHLEELLGGGLVSLRTWSTNVAQIGALEKRGYACVRRLRDDRGPGVDTVYFAKRLG